MCPDLFRREYHRKLAMAFNVVDVLHRTAVLSLVGVSVRVGTSKELVADPVRCGACGLRARST